MILNNHQKAKKLSSSRIHESRIKFGDAVKVNWPTYDQEATVLMGLDAFNGMSTKRVATSPTTNTRSWIALT